MHPPYPALLTYYVKCKSFKGNCPPPSGHIVFLQRVHQKDQSAAGEIYFYDF